MPQIGFGGGCHWCTEAIFASLKGVIAVDQGWISSDPPDDAFSEAVLISYNPDQITLSQLIEIHLYTHSATADHSMRVKYRSAIYYLDAQDKSRSERLLRLLSADFEHKLVTRVLKHVAFRSNKPEYRNYYYAAPDRPFCQTYIQPKLKLLLSKFQAHVRESTLLFEKTR